MDWTIATAMSPTRSPLIDTPGSTTAPNSGREIVNSGPNAASTSLKRARVVPLVRHAIATSALSVAATSGAVATALSAESNRAAGWKWSSIEPRREHLRAA